MRYAWRMLCRRPIAALGVIVSLSFAIGVNAAIVGLADQTFFKPLPVQEPDRLVSLYGVDTSSGTYHGTAYRTYLAYRERARAAHIVDGLAAFGRIPLEMTDPAAGARVTSIVTEQVTGDYFDVLRVQALVGRLLTPADDNAGSPPVAVIGERAWRARFNRDPQIVGRAVSLGGRAFTIVGVLPAQFRGVLLDWNGEPDAWMPLAQLPSAFDTAIATRLLDDPSVDWMMVVGRLQPDVTRERAEAAFRLIDSQLIPASPEAGATGSNRTGAAPRTIALFATNHTKFWPGARDSVEGRLTILIAGAALLLLLACVNVTTLLIERGMERQHELSLRLALGAGRWRIIRLLLAESTLLALASLGGAWLVAWFTADVIVQFRGGLGHALTLESHLDLRTFAICLAVTLLVTVACTLAPVLWSMRTDALGALRTTPRLAGSSRRATLARNALVAAQVCISMIVLMAAGAFIDTLLRAERVHLGFDTDRLVFVQPEFSLKRYTPDAALQLTNRIITNLRANGTVSAATWSNRPALSTSRTPVTLSRDAADTASASASALTADAESIAANYFDVLGTRLLAGRSFDDHDRRDTPRVAIVNQSMARALWPAGDVVGRRVLLHRGPGRAPEPCDIIGVAANTRYATLWEDRPRMFFPMRQTDTYPTTLILRTRTAPETTTAAIEAAIATADPQLPLPLIQDWPHTRATSLVQQRLGLTLFTTFSAAMLLLTLVGLYSVTTSRVTQRRQEIALRLALGASPHHVRTTILLRTLLIATCGLAPGIALGLTATTLVATILPGLEPSHALLTVAIGVALAAITTLATLAPAQRAASTDPMRVLKE